MRHHSTSPRRIFRTHAIAALAFAASAVVAAPLTGMGAHAWAQPRGADKQQPATTPSPATTPTAPPPAADPSAAPPPGQVPASAPAEGDASAPGESDAAATGAAATATPGVTPSPEGEEIPLTLRLRRLEQRVEALKERSWRAKARVGMLKEAVLGGGAGGRASITHTDRMGNSYRLTKLTYTLDGTPIFSRDAISEKKFEVLTGPIAPGEHTLSVTAVYSGNGRGVFSYLNQYTFTVRASQAFVVDEGKATSVEAIAFERGGLTTPLQDRPAVEFKVTSGIAAEN